MKKITFLFFATIMASFSAFAVDMTGTYKVGTTLGANYTSLSAAINDLNAATITGDVVFEITSDITEAANFGLGKDMGSFKLTIRPDADANRTITYTQTAANVGPWGHFVIGYATANLGAAIAEASLQSTNNITIDGYAVGGSTRRLKFTTSATTIANSTLTTIVGGSSNITIRNCIYETKSTTATPRCINPFVVKNGTKDVAPSNILIDNNEIYSNPSSTINGTAIQCTATGSATAIIENLDITNNKIIASSTGIEIRFVNGVDITGNEIKMQKGTQTGGVYGIWLRGNTGNMNIVGNKFTETSTSQATGTVLIQTISTAANINNPFNVNIFNNTFSGMDRKATGATAINQYYIGEVGYGTTKIYHNTFYLPALTQPTQAGAYNAISFTTANYKADIQNNIFISNEDAKSILISKPVASGFTMDNNIYFLRPVNINNNAKIVDTYATLDAYQQANPTLDIHSKSIDVNFTAPSTGDLTLTGASVGNVDLAALRLSSVLTDFNTSPRAEITYKGAYEASNLTTVAKYFTVNVPNGTEKVYVAGSFTNKVWDKDAPFQLLSTGTANQFAGILPCVDGVNYKYMCATGDWDYEEGIYNTVNGAPPTKLATDRTYNATDDVVLWYRVNKITLNASFEPTTAAPTQLFVKGSFNGWGNAITMTQNGSTFSAILGGGVTDKLPANTEYKYYTNDQATENWESNLSGGDISNRWSITPIMNDKIIRFKTAITTGLDKALMQAGLQISKNGISIPANGTSSIELYTLNGTLIDKTITNNPYSRALNNGAYIVKINGKAVKFVK